MKQFVVYVDFTVTKGIYVDAENEEQAEEKAREKLNGNPYEYCMNPDSCLEYDITEVSECEPDDDPLSGYSEHFRRAVRYVKDSMDPTDMAILRANVDQGYSHHLHPSAYVNDAKVIDLLEEYGDDNELPEGWWMSEADMDDIVLLL